MKITINVVGEVERAIKFISEIAGVSIEAVATDAMRGLEDSADKAWEAWSQAEATINAKPEDIEPMVTRFLDACQRRGIPMTRAEVEAELTAPPRR